MASQHPDIEKVLFTQEDIDGIVSRLGEEITRDYAGKDLVLIAVLRGAVVFMGDLMRKIELPTNIDFMAVSSYGDGVKSSGIVRIIKDLDIDIRGRDVLIVEDILDSGLTLKYLMKNLESRKPASLEVAAFLWKDRCLCGGLRPRLCRALSQPSVSGHFETGGLFVRCPTTVTTTIP